MPALEKTDGRLPRSTLRYRPTAADTITVDEYVTGVNVPAPQVYRASRLRQPQAVDDAAEQDDSDAAQTGRGSATATRVRRNDQGEFRPLRPEEREGVERFLQQLLPSR